MDRHQQVTRIGICLLAAAIIYSLKLYYSQADIEGLRWIIGPTAMLAGGLGAGGFVWEAGAGYLSAANHAVIAPVCAGINFLIAAFCMLFFQGILRFRRNGALLLWLCFALLAAYILTLHVNALRIVISLYLYGAEWYGGWLNPERIHRFWGILLYSSSLFVVYSFVEKFVDRLGAKTNQRRGKYPGLVPLSCYLFFAVAVPLLNHPLNLKNTIVMEHYVTVICFSVLVFLLLFLIKSFHKKFRSNELL